MFCFGVIQGKLSRVFECRSNNAFGKAWLVKRSIFLFKNDKNDEHTHKIRYTYRATQADTHKQTQEHTHIHVYTLRF